MKLIDIFTDLSKTYKNIPARMKAEAFKQRVVACFRAWEVSGDNYLRQILLALLFLGLGLVSYGFPH